jgi:hypothetical protein
MAPWDILLIDHLGSTIPVADSSGTLLEQTRYLPFDQVRDAVVAVTSPDKTYTSQKSVTGTGLRDYNARMYDSYINHWI